MKKLVTKSINQFQASVNWFVTLVTMVSILSTAIYNKIEIKYKFLSLCSVIDQESKPLLLQLVSRLFSHWVILALKDLPCSAGFIDPSFLFETGLLLKPPDLESLMIMCPVPGMLYVSCFRLLDTGVNFRSEWQYQ